MGESQCAGRTSKGNAPAGRGDEVVEPEAVGRWCPGVTLFSSRSRRRVHCGTQSFPSRSTSSPNVYPPDPLVNTRSHHLQRYPVQFKTRRCDKGRGESYPCNSEPKTVRWSVHRESKMHWRDSRLRSWSSMAWTRASSSSDSAKPSLREGEKRTHSLNRCRGETDLESSVQLTQAEPSTAFECSCIFHHPPTGRSHPMTTLKTNRAEDAHTAHTRNSAMAVSTSDSLSSLSHSSLLANSSLNTRNIQSFCTASLRRSSLEADADNFSLITCAHQINAHSLPAQNTHSKTTNPIKAVPPFQLEWSLIPVSRRYTGRHWPANRVWTGRTNPQ
jgi:hypothetical protein